MKKIIISIIFISLLLPIFCLAQEQPAPTEPTQPIDIFYARALVKDIQEIQKQEQLDGTTQVITQQEVTLVILNTKLADQEFTIINEVTTNPLDIKLTKGDKLIVNIEEYSNNEYRIFITGYYRLNGILLLIGLFLLLLIILGGSQGVKTVISLILSIILIFKILIPQTLSGTDPILIALIISIAIAIIT
ncbi:MAG: hypothetical protein GF365_05015, partial [Candidatus Buchananbacteria bacterium]|nr:hypothetical protein [Candidatus Buchananbacteria bacterium]